ncbi:MAG: PKD domain-containing protein [Rhodothermales bacterium]
MNRFSTAVLGFLIATAMVPGSKALAQDGPREVIQASRHNTSVPLGQVNMPSAAKAVRAPFAIPNKGFKIDVKGNDALDKTGFTDPVLQVQGGTLAPNLFASFDGSSDDDNSAVLGFRVVPPDTDGDVGPNHYVQWINSVTEIFDKNGNTLLGPVAGNIYFQGLGGDCEADNDGDPIVLYDESADRWLVAQFSVTASPFSMCVAVSTSPDPTGSYNQYEFNFGTDFPDYPKLGIWGDSYTMTTRDFGGNGAFFSGLSAVAMDRSAMLNGQPATMVRFPNAFGGTSIDGYLPADADGAVSGPAIFGGHGDDGNTTFELWQLDVDWNNPGAATFASIPGVTIPTYDGVVPSVNQPNGQVLDDHSFFTMHRLQVRDFGGHTSMVSNHTVETTANTAGIRWYEFRNTGGNWTLHQSGTYSPDTDDRWMGSIAINANGDIALGYSRSSSAMFPSIYMTGQTADQSGTGIMNVEETLLHAGGGSQSGASRWGDYSMMSVDPVDGRFWYTTEYYAATGSFDFNTRIASFDLGGGGTGNIPPVASFTSSCTLLSCDFTDASADADGSIVSWSWTFGDGGTSTAQNPTHAYAANGTYTVGLTVTDDLGATASTSQSVTVNDGTVTATMHIASILIDAIRKTGERGRFAEATVNVVDADGNVVPGVSVTGEFYGFITETGKGPELTDGNGDAVFVSDTNGSRRRILNETFFCVTDVTGGGLTYEPADNPDAAFDCSGVTAAPGIAASDRFDALDETPADFDLAQNYPNPFNPTTIIGYSVPEASDVTVQVFNMLGQEVATLASGYHTAGRYEVAFNANNLSAGIYIYTIKTGNIAITKRMTLLK